MSIQFSVIIPTYNQADFLREALKSVFGQTYCNYEVIVINNMSTDDTVSVVEEWDVDNLTLINFPNEGIIGLARNVGIQASTGDYVAFLDSDDVWYPTKLDFIHDAIERSSNPGLFCHNQDLIRNGMPAGVARYGPQLGSKLSMHSYLLTRGNCVSTSATVVARKYLEEVGGFSEESSLCTVEDYDLWMKLAKICAFEFLPERLGVHNYHSRGASANVEVHLAATISVLSKHFNEEESLDRWGLRLAMRRLVSKAYYSAARDYQRRGGLASPIKYYALMFKSYPFQMRAIGSIALLLIDLVLGQSIRRRIVQAILPGRKFASW